MATRTGMSRRTDVLARDGRDGRYLKEGGYPGAVGAVRDQAYARYHLRRVRYSQYAHAHGKQGADLLLLVDGDAPDDLPRQHSERRIHGAGVGCPTLVSTRR